MQYAQRDSKTDARIFDKSLQKFSFRLSAQHISKYIRYAHYIYRCVELCCTNEKSYLNYLLLEIEKLLMYADVEMIEQKFKN